MGLAIGDLDRELRSAFGSGAGVGADFFIAFILLLLSDFLAIGVAFFGDFMLLAGDLPLRLVARAGGGVLVPLSSTAGPGVLDLDDLSAGSTLCNLMALATKPIVGVDLGAF